VYINVNNLKDHPLCSCKSYTSL